MAPSTNLFLFQRAYVLRTKKPELIELVGSGVTGDREIHSEQITDNMAKAVRELSKDMSGQVYSMHVHSKTLLILRHI